MMYHNVFDMSTTTTPARLGRGMPVPGIDTDSATKTSFNQGWPLTPPQSAISNESRRPSLAYSSLSEAASSGPSSVCGYSQPATPVNTMRSSQAFCQQWSEDNDIHTSSIQNGMSNACSNGQMGQTMFSSAYGGQPTPAYSVAESFGLQSAQQPSWTQAQEISPIQYQNGTQSGLGTTLFQTSQALGPEAIPTASMYANPGDSVSPLGASAFDQPLPYATSSAPAYQPTQVVVPSQVAPNDDYAMEDFAGYQTHDAPSDGYTNSFNSTDSGYSTWEMVGPQSPVDAYFGHSDEDDYVNVKDEIHQSPARVPAYGLASPYSVSRPRRRNSRRARKTNHSDKAWYESESHGIRMRCEGKRFSVIPNTSPSSTNNKSFSIIPSESTRDTKPHKCTFINPSTQELCGRRFERSEHLKRHYGSHTGDRPFPCPLSICDKAIGRPDNATDHFKTHLKATPRGRRNKPCTWKDMEEAIKREYEEKQAGKLLANLRKWMVDEARKREVEEVRKRRS